MDWTEIKITVDTKDIDTAGDIANMVVPYGIYIEDYSDLEREAMEIAHIDLIDEDLLAKDRTKGIVHIYIDPQDHPQEAAAFLTERLAAAGIENEIDLTQCKNADWENNWKQYYKPMEIGERLLVVPQWEQEDPQVQASCARRVPLILEPGLTFGTGSHATTRLCLTALERLAGPGQRVLDLGCGSGILSIAALKLGADNALAVDIDDKCLDVAYENAAMNGIGRDRYTVLAGDILTDEALQARIGGGYDIVLANIVSDVIITLAPAVRPLLKEGGYFLCSGIIDDRAEEVAGKLRDAGLTIEETHSADGWFSYLCR